MFSSLCFGGSQPDIIVSCTGIAGLAVTYALNLNGQLSNITWNICDAENKMISVERIMQYSRIPSEAPLIVDDNRPPNSWPKDGTINIRNLEVCIMLL
jgi:ATP-binding cassette subfamily C (CFTR/MRP) protein 1